MDVSFLFLAFLISLFFFNGAQEKITANLALMGTCGTPE